jgi:hypothetical protein
MPRLLEYKHPTTNFVILNANGNRKRKYRPSLEAQMTTQPQMELNPESPTIAELESLEDAIFKTEVFRIEYLTFLKTNHSPKKQALKYFWTNKLWRERNGSMIIKNPLNTYMK